MKLQIGKHAIALVTATVLPATLAFAQAPSTINAKTAPSTGKIHRTADGHPDLSGTWTFGIDLPHGDLEKVVNGKVAGPTTIRAPGTTRTAVCRASCPGIKLLRTSPNIRKK